MTEPAAPIRVHETDTQNSWLLWYGHIEIQLKKVEISVDEIENDCF